MKLDTKNLEKYQYGWHDPEKYAYAPPAGINRSIVEQISKLKKEPRWMLEKRLKGLTAFLQKPLPQWGADLSKIDFQKFRYYLKPATREKRRWEDVPAQIKRTFDRLGIPQAEREYLAGVKAQYDSEVIYGSLRKVLAKKGVVFLGMDEGLQKYPDLVKKYFSTLVPVNDNKFAALNTAVWSGGSFIYVPPGVKVQFPLQAYFRINAPYFGQFERTLIIADEGSFVHYLEGCTAPSYSAISLHAAVVEIIVKPKARVRYTTIQNWSHNVYNLVTKRAWVEREGIMEWVDSNLGSGVNMKYPSCILAGERAHGELLSLSFAGRGQHQDSGGKMIHLAPNTTGEIVSKSISKNGGRASYRGLVHILPKAKNCRSSVACDALILDKESRSDTYPLNKIENTSSIIEHEASVYPISQEQLFYLTSRGVPKQQAKSMIIAGFIQPIVKQLPLEYAVELNRLIELEMEGAVG
jgi:Fe-S cluster assembly protein SufB